MLKAFIIPILMSLFDFMLPSDCLLCGQRTRQPRLLCPPCQSDLPILPHHCQQCAQVLPLAAPSVLICGTCLAHPPAFTRTYALYAYAFPIIPLILQLKFRHRLPMARAFGQLLAERIQTVWYAEHPLPDVIIPLPLHPHRLRERGFNQALEIAKPLARRLGIPLDRNGVARLRHTKAQSGLTAGARRVNIKGAFSVRQMGRYQGRVVALLDDVVTTGNTVRECSRELMRCGAKRVDIWCVARA